MRVIAGSARRLLLKTPEGLETRPTQDIIKETLFNIIQFDVPGCIFADLCAGSGAIGIEALSRGAKKAYFAENSREAIRCIQDNLVKTHFTENGILLKMDALNALDHIHEKRLDIVYIDPPYASDTAQQLLLSLAGRSCITKDSLIIVETALGTDFSVLDQTDLKIVREKDYRANRHLFIRRG